MRLLSSLAIMSAAAVALAATSKTKEIKNNNPLIYYHGRWDASPGTWWADSGLKLHFTNLKSLSLNLGNHTTSPFAAVGVSVNYQDYFTVNASAGVNDIPLSGAKADSTVVRINVEGWQNNRINLESLTVNSDAVLLPYSPSKLTFQFIGDSLSAGQFLPLGVNQAWPFLVGELVLRISDQTKFPAHYGESYKAEHRINAQPGATLKDIPSYGNVHGVSYQFFKTEDTGFYYTSDHNYTTPWNFIRDQPAPTHIVIHIGANDASQGVTDADFVLTYSAFLTELRVLYPFQPIFVFTPWGWPSADGNVYYYYQGLYETIVNIRHTIGDKNVFLVNTTGWVTFDDVYPDNVHPDVGGHAKIANEFQSWLENWGLKPQSKWSTL